MSGQIPALSGPFGPDYMNNWGIMMGVNASADTSRAPSGRTFSSISFKFSGAPTAGVQAVVHLSGDPEMTAYCVKEIESGQSIDVTEFNTACYSFTDKRLTVADTKRIDWVALWVQSTSSAITINNLCWDGVTVTLIDNSPTTATASQTATVTSTAVLNGTP